MSELKPCPFCGSKNIDRLEELETIGEIERGEMMGMGGKMQ